MALSQLCVESSGLLLLETWLMRAVRMNQNCKVVGHKTKKRNKKMLKHSGDLRGTAELVESGFITSDTFHIKHSHLIHCSYETIDQCSFKFHILYLTMILVGVFFKIMSISSSMKNGFQFSFVVEIE